eukprot:gene10903-22757_t
MQFVSENEKLSEVPIVTDSGKVVSVDEVKASCNNLKRSLSKEFDLADFKEENNAADVELPAAVEIDVVVLKQFRETLTPEINAVFSDNDCARFLRARYGNVSKASDMVHSWWIWWNQPLLHVVEGIALKPSNVLLCGDIIKHPKQHIIDKYLPHLNVGEDKEGRPIYWEKTGDVSKYLHITKQEFDIEAMAFLHLRQQELSLRRLEFVSQKYGKTIEKQLVIFDLTNINYSPDAHGFRSFHRFLMMDEAYYPERLEACLMINAPWFFTFIWSIIRPWMNPITAKKIEIIGTDFLPALRQRIDDSQIPVEYGGSMEGCVFHRPWPECSGCSSEQVLAYLAKNNITLESATAES